jgi:PIN domain nuclease of toxin-antitoxin system
VSDLDVAEMISGMALTVLPFTQEHTRRMLALPLYHRDPLDRMIIAAALVERVPVASGDRQFCIRVWRLSGSRPGA